MTAIYVLGTILVVAVRLRPVAFCLRVMAVSWFVELSRSEGLSELAERTFI